MALLWWSIQGFGCAGGSDAPLHSKSHGRGGQQKSGVVSPPTPRVPKAPTPNTPPTPVRPGAASPPVDYVIVAADLLQASARRWKAFRQRSGYRVELVLTSTLVAASTPAKARSETLRRGIRAHLQARWKARDPAKPLYVLLLGDAHHPLPAWTHQNAATPTKSNPRTRAPIVTDNPYADMDGDGIPDLALGRIPALSDAEADRVLRKTERYESTYRVGLWNRRINLFAAPGDYGAFVDSLLEVVARDLLEQLSYDYDLHVLYGARSSPAAYPPTAFSDRVYELLNGGSLFTVYLGHGTPKGTQYGWWAGKSYDVWKSNQLQRKLRMRHKSSLLLLVACEMGTFADQDGFGEKLLRHPQGPPAVMAATAVSHPYPNTLLVQALGDLVTNARVRTAGLLLQRAKARLMRQRDASRDVLEGLASLVSTELYREQLKKTHLRMYLLLGDPALKIRYVTGRAKLRLTTRRPGAGKKLTVTARIDAPTTGVARFTLESRRKVILGRLNKLPAKSGPRQDRVLRQNYRTANDKVVATRAVRYTGGRARVTLAVPKSLPPGTYYVKVYAEDGHKDGMGSVAVRIK